MVEDALVRIAGEGLSAAINPFGAELTHLQDAEGRELMTDADPAFWTGHAPLLFPIVGALNGDRYRFEGQTYALPKHGFARRSAFALIAHAPDLARFRLTDSAATRAAYPFAFTLEAEYRIVGATLFQTVTATNCGDRDMPASFGFHPAFAWPLPYGAPREEHRVTFERPEPQPLRKLTEAGLIAPEPRESPLADECTLYLRDDLFTQDALIWDRIDSAALRYGAAQGPALEIGFPATPMLGIWTRPGAAYVCLEPWHGIADPEGFAGDIRDKPGMGWLSPGESRSWQMDVRLRT